MAFIFPSDNFKKLQGRAVIFIALRGLETHSFLLAGHFIVKVTPSVLKVEQFRTRDLAREENATN